jgi:8-oxo-dGTP pyrophosphatase MutT (NUDIX family)|tara:strand:+ start:299 stop:1150 length:852 start_codon:yes stop_codon:yes gene_type:complete
MKKNNIVNNNNNYLRTQTCRNCGLNGHLYKDCIHPIMSFGIICYKIENNNIKYLMIQRKDSLSFMEFIRGKYETNNVDYISQLINNMTKEEKKLLEKKDFESIWNYAWSQPHTSNIKNTSEYMESKRKYLLLINNNILNELIDKSKNNRYEQEWGFPKGRRKLKESAIDCAIREFCEETRLNKKDFDIKYEFGNFEEIFYGTNNILYKHVYYVAKINNDNIKLELDYNCVEQVREIRALVWYSFNEVLNKIKKKNVERIDLFKLTDNLINEKENNIILHNNNK